MSFPKNNGLIQKIIVDDPLHIAAIDFTCIELAPSNIVTIRGITKKNSHWVLINGMHNINYGENDRGQSCYIRINRDKDMCTIEIFGEEPIKTMTKILNAKRIKIIDESFIREIDIFIMNEKTMLVNGGFVMDVVSIPIDDIYIIHKTTERGYMILQKETKDDNKSYIIDIVGDYYNKIITDILNGNADRVRVINCSVINDHISVRTMDKIPLQHILTCQQTIIDYTINAYHTSKNKNITILISGQPGSGKSTVAFAIAQMMKKTLSVDPYLIKGFNINCEEIQYHPVMNHYSPKIGAPIILLLDEFDIAMGKADAPIDDNNAHAISANKTNLNNFLDAINEEQFLITIATTNLPLLQINNQFAVYCRKGRFDKHYEIQSKDVALAFDPPF